MKTTLLEAERMLEALIRAGIPALLRGGVGIGKSAMPRGYAKKQGWGFIDLRLTQKNIEDLTGLPDIDRERRKTIWTTPDFWPDVKRDGERGILLVDEIADAAKAMQSVAYQLFLERRIGENEIPEGWYVMAACNRRSDRAAAGALSLALLNRMAVLEIEHDHKSFIAWAAAAGVAPELIGFIGFAPRLLHVMPPAGDESPFPTPRQWERVARLINEPADILPGLVSSLVGDGPAAEFCAFLEIYRSLPPIDEILKNPDGVNVPDADKPAVQWAVASALSRFATAANFGNVLRFTKRLSPELDVMVATEATRRDPALAHTPAFGQWAVRNKAVTVRKGK